MSISPAAPASENPFTSRKLALGALLLGCALTLIAPFLPIVHVTYACDASDCAPYSKAPVQDLLAIAQQRLGASAGAWEAIPVAAVFAFVLWGIPLILTALSGRMLLAWRRAASWRTGVPFLILVVIGAAIAGLECVFYQLHFLDYLVTYTLMYGAAVTFLGYLFALVGGILLMASPAPVTLAAPAVVAGARGARWRAGSALLLSLALPAVGRYLVIWTMIHIAPSAVSSLGALDLGYPWLALWMAAGFTGGWLLALLFVGAPIVLAILGTVTLSARSWIPGRRAVILGAVVTALGAASALIEIILYVFPRLIVTLGLSASIPPGSGSPRPVVALEVIPMLLGYLLALIGTILLPRIASRAAGVSSAS